MTEPARSHPCRVQIHRTSAGKRYTMRGSLFHWITCLQRFVRQIKHQQDQRRSRSVRRQSRSVYELESCSLSDNRMDRSAVNSLALYSPTGRHCMHTIQIATDWIMGVGNSLLTSGTAASAFN